MSLIKYKKKRSFKDTPEPQGGVPSTKQLRFVVQKHQASHLHYDFRLEMNGVLKSWAIPKGPSMDPSVKRLAMMVEDHPYDYGTFEGVIPEGNYGAGTVMLWDEGYYEATDEDGEISKETEDKNFRRQLHQGKIKFVLHGKKLKGSFVLIKAAGKADNAWLLMKMSDRFATSGDILLRDRSVLSRRTLKGISEHPPAVYGSKSTAKTTVSHAVRKAVSTGRKSPAKRPAAGTRKINEKKAKETIDNRGVKASLPPKELLPMLTTLVDKPFDEQGWLYEIKWDGYRAVSYLHQGEVRILSRNSKSFDDKFYPVHDALRGWPVNAVVDGEIVVLNKHGRSDFSALQNWRSEADGHLVYYLFDVLWLNGEDLRSLPLDVRKKKLEEIIPTSDTLRLSDSFYTSGTEIYKRAADLGLEGIIAKKIKSIYSAGQRTTDWLKIKINKRQEVVIGGYTVNEGSPKLFSALLVGVFNKGKFQYTGKVGTGFNGQVQQDMMRRFKSLTIGQSPFQTTPDVSTPSRFRPNPPKSKVTWLRPELVCEVAFAEMTNDGVMRHPSFQGMREDKSPSSVVLEKEQPVETVVRRTTGKAKDLLLPEAEQARKSLLNPNDETQVRKVGGHELKFTNLSKVYWPDVKVTKRDMINYYYQIAPFILPYLVNRPQSLNRFPNGIKGKSFYQKDVTGKVPEWVKTYLYHSSDSTEDKHFMVPETEADLLLMATMGCIEMNPWSSTIDKPDHPDWCIIDLDPDKNSFEQVITAARVTKEVLDDIGAVSCCKTSGSTGLHIYIPLGAKYTFEESKEFARELVTIVNHTLPGFTSIERMVSRRKGKMYLDFLQNRPKATLAAPYSLRPKPGATVSMPLHWDEVKAGLKLSDFTIHNAVERVRNSGDLFSSVLGKGVNLVQLSKKLQALDKVTAA